MRHHFLLPFLAIAIIPLTMLSAVGCSSDKGTNATGSSSSSSVSSSSGPAYGTPEYWEEQWQESLAYFNCPQPTDTIEGWKLAGLKTGVSFGEPDSNMVMQIREHNGTLIIRTYRGDMWQAHYPELEWIAISLPDGEPVKKLHTQGDSIFATTSKKAELWTAKFSDLEWRRLSPPQEELRTRPSSETRLAGSAAYQRGDTLFFGVLEVTNLDSTGENWGDFNEERIYAKIDGVWRQTTAITEYSDNALQDGLWKFAEVRDTLFAITYSQGVWAWIGGIWRKFPFPESTPAAAYLGSFRDIAEWNGEVWLLDLRGWIGSSSNLSEWTDRNLYRDWTGDDAKSLGTPHMFHPYDGKLLVGTSGGVKQWSETEGRWLSITVNDCREKKTTRAPRTSYTGWGPPGLVHEFVILDDTIVAGVADYNAGLSGVYMFNLKEATWR